MTHMMKPPVRGIMAVRADTSDPVALVGQIKTAFEQFKEANDERLKQIEAKGAADVVTSQKVDAINATISDLQAQLADVATKAAAASINGPGQSEVVKAAAEFTRERGVEISTEDYQAYKASLNVYMRKGQATPAGVMAAMSVGSDPDGGYSVTPDMSGRIVTRVYETSPMRSVASVITIGTDSIEGFNDLGEGDAGWVSEQGARDETDTPQLGKWSIPVHEIYAMPKTTQKLLDDSMFDIEGWLAGKTADKFARVENAAFLTGDGTGKPRGLLTYTTAATADATRAWGSFQHVNTGTSSGFGTAPNGSDKLIDLVFTLKAAYRNNAAWMMNRGTLAEVRKLKDGDGNYLWQPDFSQRQGGLLLGYNIAEAEDMPAVAANSLSIAFGDFRETYTIVDRVGIRVLRDPFTSKGFVKFYTTKRVGGGAISFEACKFLRFGTA